MVVKQNGMKRTKPLSAHSVKRQFPLLVVFFENILIRADTVNIWLGFGIGGLTMDEYISRKAAIAYIHEQSEECQKAFEELGGESGIYADAYNDLAENFYSITAADVASVVRCKDCYQSAVIDDVFYCTYWGKNTDENGYCHEGG